MLPIERNTTKTTKHSRQCKKHACKKKRKSKNHTQTRFIFKASFLDYFLFQGYFSVKFIIYSQTQRRQANHPLVYRQQPKS